MMRIIGLVFLATLSLTACTSAPQSPPTVGLAEPDSSIPARYAEFYGVWSGKWDDYWDVTFVIDEIRDDGFVRSEYYWKESVPGPWSHQVLDGYIKDGSAELGNIRIDLDATMSNVAIAYGDFPTDRTARLRKLTPTESALVPGSSCPGWPRSARCRAIG